MNTFEIHRILWVINQFWDSETQIVKQIPIFFQKDVEKIFDSYTNITNKYRKLLEEESLVQQSTQKVHELREELTKTQTELEDSRKKLAVQTQRFVNQSFLKLI